MAKVTSKSAPPFAAGGKTKMFGKGNAVPQTPGQSTSLGSGGGKAGSAKKMAGGKAPKGKC